MEIKENKITGPISADLGDGLTHFPTGAIRDDGKNKEDYIESISWTALRRYAFYMKKKAKTYGEGNWRKGIPVFSYEKSLARHLQKYLENKYEDGVIEKDEDHLSAILFNCLGLIHEEEKLKKIAQLKETGV